MYFNYYKNIMSIYYKYPQYLWAKEIYSIIEEYDILNNRKIIDAPSGNGVISYWLYKNYNINDIELVDNNSQRLGAAKKYMPSLKISCKDILEINCKDRNDDIWLFINSLYCLENGELVVSHLKNRFKYIIGIFPYIDHNNFKTFIEKNPGFKNPLELNEDDTVKLFRKSGYELIFKKDITHIPFHSYNYEIIKKSFNILDKYFKSSAGAYWISLFKKI